MNVLRAYFDHAPRILSEFPSTFEAFIRLPCLVSQTCLSLPLPPPRFLLEEFPSRRFHSCSHPRFLHRLVHGLVPPSLPPSSFMICTRTHALALARRVQGPSIDSGHRHSSKLHESGGGTLVHRLHRPWPPPRGSLLSFLSMRAHASRRVPRTINRER